MELLCPGLLYMFISRATTIRTPENWFNSALFFSSNNINRARISNTTRTKNGTETEKIKKEKMDKIPSTTQTWNKIKNLSIFCK